jgi:hypothetical protein
MLFFNKNYNLLDVFEKYVVKKSEEEFESIQKRWEEEKATIELNRQQIKTCQHIILEKGNIIGRIFRELADVTDTIRRLNVIIKLEEEDLKNSKSHAQSNHSLRDFYRNHVLKKEIDIQQWTSKRNALTQKYKNLYQQLEDLGFHSVWIQTIMSYEMENFSQVMKQIRNIIKTEVYGVEVDLKDIPVDDDRWDLMQEKMKLAKNSYFDGTWMEAKEE